MKKLTLLLCMNVLVLSLAACGNRAEEGGSGENTASESTVESGAGESGTAENSGAESASPADESMSESGTEDPGTDPAQGWSQEMERLKAAVVEAVGEADYWPDVAVDPEMLEMFNGLTSDLYEDYLAERPMISGNVDELVIVRAKEDKVDEVEAVLTAYRDTNVNDTMQYPQNLGKIQASRVEKIGQYVIFVQLGGYAIDSEDEEEVLTLCQEANQKAVDAVRKILEQ